MGQIFYEEALEQFAKARNLDPNNLITTKLAAKTLDSLGKCEEAIEEYKKVIAEDPTDVDVCRGLAESYSFLNQHTESTMYFEKVLEHEPQNIEVQKHLGHAYLQQENFPKATQHLQQILAFGYDTEVLLNLATVHFLQNNIEECFKLFDKVTLQGSQHYHSNAFSQKLTEIAQQLFQTKGNVKEVTEALNRALSFNPRNTEAQSLISLVRGKQDKYL